jgi:hypothetical protein
MSEKEVDESLAKIAEETQSVCDHGVAFDSDAAKGLSSADVQKRWPRGWGLCPKGCGFNGIAYASYEHMIMGDW